MRSTTYWLFSARELAIPQIPKFVLLLAVKHPKFLFTNASPTFALITNVPCHATRPPLSAAHCRRLARFCAQAPASPACFRAPPRTCPPRCSCITQCFSTTHANSSMIHRKMFATAQKTTELWMWKMEYLHHEQRPLYFGEWF